MLVAGGHYTAYARPSHKIAEREHEWYHFNDSSVSKIDASKVVSEKAYLLFYQLDLE